MLCRVTAGAGGEAMELLEVEAVFRSLWATPEIRVSTATLFKVSNKLIML